MADTNIYSSHLLHFVGNQIDDVLLVMRVSSVSRGGAGGGDTYTLELARMPGRFMRVLEDGLIGAPLPVTSLPSVLPVSLPL